MAGWTKSFCEGIGKKYSSVLSQHKAYDLILANYGWPESSLSILNDFTFNPDFVENLSKGEILTTLREEAKKIEDSMKFWKENFDLNPFNLNFEVNNNDAEELYPSTSDIIASVRAVGFLSLCWVYKDHFIEPYPDKIIKRLEDMLIDTDRRLSPENLKDVLSSYNDTFNKAGIPSKLEFASKVQHREDYNEIQIGGWIPNNRSLEILVRPTKPTSVIFAYEIGEEFRIPDRNEVLELRKMKRLLQEGKESKYRDLNWHIVNRESKQILVKRVAFDMNERELKELGLTKPPMKRSGAIIVVENGNAYHMGSSSEGTIMSPYILFDYKKFANYNKVEKLADRGIKNIEIIVEFEFKDFSEWYYIEEVSKRRILIPTAKNIVNAKIVDARPLGGRK